MGTVYRDRMNEAYRQHGMFVRPHLARPPKEYLYRQVYVSFQHDETAPAAVPFRRKDERAAAILAARLMP